MPKFVADLFPNLSQATTHGSPDTDVGAGSLHHTIGPGAAQVVAGNDPRLTNARTPVAHSHAPSEVTGTAVITADLRLSDARMPSNDAALMHLAGAETVTGAKMFSAPVCVAEQSTPTATPSAIAVYAKADGHLYSLSDTGAEVRHPPVTVSDLPPSTPKPGDLWVATGVGGASTPGNFSVGPGDPLLQGAGLWVQTGLGDGSDFTMWIEDGT